MSKIISAEDAVKLIKDDQTLAVNGFVGFGVPEELLVALEKRFLETQEPKNLTLFNCAGNGDGKSRGLNHMGHEGLLRKVICGHIGLAPKLYKMAAESKIECYIIPQGVTTHLCRAIAGGKPGVLTHVGLKTFADPRIEACHGNPISKDEVVKLLNIEGKEWLLYKSFPIDVCFIRATTADTKGNLTMEKEALFLEALPMATACRNSGGIVIAQVERVTEYGTLKAQDVKVPAMLVDHIVVAKPNNHPQSFMTEEYLPYWTGETRIPLDSIEAMSLNERKVCGRRGALELSEGAHVNLGIGVAEAVAAVAAEEGINNQITLSIESGTIGGVPAGGLGIGATFNPDAIIDQVYQFDYYDGGGIDLAYLGAAEIDADGNVNVSKFGGRVVGPGGFVNITQNAKNVFFCGTFTAGGLKVKPGGGKLEILQEGKGIKFKKKVEQITFSGEYAMETGQKVMYITERCVFELTSKGIKLTEIAPGIDLEKDVLAHMEFRPIIEDDLKLMDERIFIDQLMNLKIKPKHKY